MAGRAGAGRDRGVEAVDVDGDVVADAGGDPVQRALGAEPAHVAHREDVRAGPARVVVVVAVGGGDVADAHLGHARDPCHLRGAAQRIAVAVAHAVALVDEVEVGVEVDDMERRLLGIGGETRRRDRVVAAQDDRQRAAFEDLADRGLGVGVAFRGVGMDDVGVAQVDDPDLVDRQVGDVVLEVVGAAVAEGEQRRGLADRARPEARAGAVLRAHVERRAEHRDVGVDPIPVEADRLLGEGAVTDEW